MKGSDTLKNTDIRVWKIDRQTCYIKVPYQKRGILNRRNPVITYCKDGRKKYIQYEISSEEAQRIYNTTQEVFNV